MACPANHTGPSTSLAIDVLPLERTFHPKLHITLTKSFSARHNPSDADGDSDSACYALVTLTLPDEVFVDRDELAELWGRETVMREFELDVDVDAKGGRVFGAGAEPGAEGDNSDGAAPFGVKAWMLAPDVIDIERPARDSSPAVSAQAASETVSGGTESEVRLSLALVMDRPTATLVVPLHGRYVEPTAKGYRIVTLLGEGGGSLRAGWQCAMSKNPKRIFMRPPPKPHGKLNTTASSNECHTVTLCVSPGPPRAFVHPINLTLPTAHPAHRVPVELATATAIWLGWLYLVWKVWRLAIRVDSQQKQVHKPKRE